MDVALRTEATFCLCRVGCVRCISQRWMNTGLRVVLCIRQAGSSNSSAYSVHKIDAS